MTVSYKNGKSRIVGKRYDKGDPVKTTPGIRVPYGMTVHGQDEIDAVIKALKASTQMGKHVFLFEKKIAQIFNKKHGIMVNSGSSANYLAIEILDLPQGSEVITPVLTFATTVAPLIKNKLVPVFVDVEPGTYNIDASKIEQAITKKTSALMIPSLIGNLPDWKKIKELADKYNLIVIEDSADTLGATLNSISTGKYSHISTTSFYGSHIINCAGNGGMLCVNNDDLANSARLLRSWGRSSSLFVDSENVANRFNVNLDSITYDAKFIFEHIGYNLEPSEVGAAFGLVQLEKLHDNITKRIENFNLHYNFFKSYEQWFVLPKQLAESYTGWLAFPITVKEVAPFTRTELQIYLEKHNIQTRTVFTGNILRQPAFKNIVCVGKADDYNCADEVMRGGMLIGCHHGLDEKHIKYVHEIFNQFSKKFVSTINTGEARNALIG